MCCFYAKNEVIIWQGSEWWGAAWSGAGSAKDRRSGYQFPTGVISQEQFLAARGLSSPVSSAGVDMIGGANMTRMSQRQREKTYERISQESDAYHERRAAAIKEYEQGLKSGAYRQPTALERTLLTAQGHPDLASTKAARRMAEQRGYDWRTGKPLKAR